MEDFARAAAYRLLLSRDHIYLQCIKVNKDGLGTCLLTRNQSPRAYNHKLPGSFFLKHMWVTAALGKP